MSRDKMRARGKGKYLIVRKSFTKHTAQRTRAYVRDVCFSWYTQTAQLKASYLCVWQGKATPDSGNSKPTVWKEATAVVDVLLGLNECSKLCDSTRQRLIKQKDKKNKWRSRPERQVRRKATCLLERQRRE